MRFDTEILSDFELLTEIGYDLSLQFEGIKTQDRRKSTSTHLLATIIPTCISILKLIPESKFNSNDENEDFYDFPSIASLARNVIEATNILYYICIDKITAEEESFRFKLYDLHEASELLTIIKQLNSSPKDQSKIELELQRHKSALEKDPFFQKLNSNQQKLLVNGKRCTHLTQFEIAKRRTLDIELFKGMYKLMSNQTHAAPLAVKFNVVGARLNKRNEQSAPLIELMLNYTSHFLADSIQSISTLWGKKFSNQESKAKVAGYSDELQK